MLLMGLDCINSASKSVSYFGCPYVLLGGGQKRTKRIIHSSAHVILAICLTVVSLDAGQPDIV